MPKIFKFKDWKVQNKNAYKQQRRDDLGTDVYDHIWYPGDISQEGTIHDEEKLNELQKQGVYYVELEKNIDSGAESYEIVDFEGINDFGIFKGLKLKALIKSGNNTNNPTITIGGLKYSILRQSDDGPVPVGANHIESNKYYDFHYNGVYFIVDKYSLKGTDRIEGITKVINNFKGGEGAGSAYDVKWLRDNQVRYYGENGGEGAAFIRNDGVMEAGHIIDFRHLNSKKDFDTRLELNSTNSEFYRVKALDNGTKDAKKILTESDIKSNFQGGNGVSSADDVKWIKENLIHYYGENGGDGAAFIRNDGVMEAGHIIDFRHMNSTNDFDGRILLKEDGEFYKVRGDNHSDIKKILTQSDITGSFQGGNGVASANDVKWLKDNRITYFNNDFKVGAAMINADGVLEGGRIIDFKNGGSNKDYEVRLEKQNDNNLYQIQSGGTPKKILNSSDIADHLNGGQGVLSAQKGKELYQNSLVYKKELTSDNLNNIVETGIYAQNHDENINVNLNYPTKKSGMLTVKRNSNIMISQEYHTYGIQRYDRSGYITRETVDYNQKFIRTNYMGEWSPWKRLTSEYHVAMSGQPQNRRVAKGNYVYIDYSQHLQNIDYKLIQLSCRIAKDSQYDQIVTLVGIRGSFAEHMDWTRYYGDTYPHLVLEDRYQRLYFKNDGGNNSGADVGIHRIEVLL